MKISFTFEIMSRSHSLNVACISNRNARLCHIVALHIIALGGTFEGRRRLQVVVGILSRILALFLQIAAWWSCKDSVCSRYSPQSCLDPPKSGWHDGQRRINEAGKCIRENTALRTKFRGGVRVQACHAAVCIEFAFGRFGVITTQAF